MKIFSQLKKSLAIAKKNLRIYYMKGPVLIFGLLLPFFFFLSFWLGREMSPLMLGTALVGMAIWFTSTSISPVITPWETMTKTLERLISSPVGHGWILLGDILASATIGLIMTAVPLVLALILLDLAVFHPLVLTLVLILGSLCFSAVGVLISALPTDSPSDVMMLSSLVKFPLVFISGIFIPINELPGWGQIVSYFSPLTYFTNLVRWSFDGNVGFGTSQLLNLVILTALLILFSCLAVFAHKKALPKRL